MSKKSRLVTPGQAHSAGGMLSDKLMEWGADKARVQRWMDDPKHLLWTEINRQLAPIRTIPSMIEEGGYKEIHGAITERNFPGRCELGENPILMEFHRNDPLEAIISRINEAGKRPATIWDLLDFGIDFSKHKMTLTIIAFGSQVQNGDPSEFWCPILYSSGSTKIVGIMFFFKRTQLSQDSFFLVVDK